MIHWSSGRADKATSELCSDFINFFLSRSVTRPHGILKLREVKELEKLSLVKENLEVMSVLKVVQDEIKRGVEQQLWDMIDPNNVLKLVPTEGVDLDVNQRTIKRSILNHYLDYIVGNVAILWSSRDT